MYDDEGFVVRYFKGVLPSNTLAAMRSLTLEVAEKWEKKNGTRLVINNYDDIVDVIPYKKIARKNRGTTRVVAALVGVQTNQFIRASDIAKRLTDLGVKTLIGGFHVSGIFALFNEPSPDLQELIDYGVTLVQGEAEVIWEQILSDIVAGEELPLYRVTEYPDISHAPIPRMPDHYLKKFAIPNIATIDCSRGCPFNCSFCTIINVQGRKMRSRNAEIVLKAIRENYSAGVEEYFFTDDNFSRNPVWEEILDGMIHLREVEGLDILFMMQIDTVCNKVPRFVEKAARAGCSQVFIGMESLNSKNLESVGKTQNKVENYARFIQAWHDVGVVTHVGYIIGFPFDTPASIREDIRKLKEEIKVDQASFFILTPLPGSQDHYDMVYNGDYIDSDFNKFDSFHVVMDHPRMTSDEWFNAYNETWKSFYETDNLKRVLLRSSAKSYWSVFKNIMWYKNSLLEPRHPMITGFVRKKPRTDIRSGVEKMGRLAHAMMLIRGYLSGLMKRVGLFFELQELWWVTRKQDDPRFKFVVDFTTALTEARINLSSIDFNDSYARYLDDINTIFANLKTKLGEYNRYRELKVVNKKRLDALIEDINSSIDNFQVSERYNRSLINLTLYLNNAVCLVEEFSLKNVARRRRITDFWTVTWERLKKGKFIRFGFSMPKIFVSAIRDFRMSLSFTYHLLANVDSCSLPWGN